MCDALYKMGCAPLFISAVGDDHAGNLLMETIPGPCKIGVKTVKNHDSGQCHVVLYPNGNCPFLIGNMSIHAKITEEFVLSFENEMKKAPLLIIDGNLSVETIQAAMSFGAKNNIPVFFEPTDISVAEKPFKAKKRHLSYITPNVGELKLIMKYLDLKVEHSNHELEQIALMAKALTCYIPVVIPTLDKNGVMIVSRRSATEPLLTSDINLNSGKISARHYKMDHVENIVSVSGAGDCFASGLVLAMLEGLSEEQCISVGFEAAKCSLFSPHAVPSTFFDKNHKCWNEAQKYSVIF